MTTVGRTRSTSTRLAVPGSSSPSCTKNSCNEGFLLPAISVAFLSQHALFVDSEKAGIAEASNLVIVFLILQSQALRSAFARA